MTKAKVKTPQKRCFLICPIGEEGSEFRKHSDQVKKYILKDIFETREYELVRADEITDIGMISSQIINHIIEDDIVVADLSFHNPNVFYELAIRHMTGKPFIQISKSGDRIPFDVAGQRTIFFDLSDLESVEKCRDKIEKMVESLGTKKIFESPISSAVTISNLGSSPHELGKSISDLISTVEDMSFKIEEVGDTVENIASATVYDSDYGYEPALRDAIDTHTVDSFLEALEKFAASDAPNSECITELRLSGAELTDYERSTSNFAFDRLMGVLRNLQKN